MTMSQNTFLPNFFILGAAKCGTTTLYAYLENMPDICMSRSKEPFFFEAEFEKGLDFYRKKYFAHWKGEPVIGDARHRNLYLPYVPHRIHQINPDAKLLVILRNPVDRALSHWHHRCYHKVETLPFEEAIQEDFKRIEKGLQYNKSEEIAKHAQAVLDPSIKGSEGLYRTFLDSGYYYEQIQRYLELFPMENLKVALLEDLSARPEEIINDLVTYLELNPLRNRFSHIIFENAARLLVNKRSARYRMWKLAKSFQKRGLLPARIWQGLKSRLEPKAKKDEDRPRMDAHMRSWLKNHYQEHNMKLGEFLNRDLSHWV